MICMWLVTAIFRAGKIAQCVSIVANQYELPHDISGISLHTCNLRPKMTGESLRHTDHNSTSRNSKWYVSSPLGCGKCCESDKIQRQRYQTLFTLSHHCWVLESRKVLGGWENASLDVGGGVPWLLGIQMVLGSPHREAGNRKSGVPEPAMRSPGPAWLRRVWKRVGVLLAGEY